MISMLAPSEGDCGFKPRSCQTKDYNIGICCFSAKHTASRSKSKKRLAWNLQSFWMEWHVYPSTVVSV